MEEQQQLKAMIQWLEEGAKIIDAYAKPIMIGGKLVQMDVPREQFDDWNRLECLATATPVPDDADYVEIKNAQYDNKEFIAWYEQATPEARTEMQRILEESQKLGTLAEVSDARWSATSALRTRITPETRAMLRTEDTPAYYQVSQLISSLKFEGVSADKVNAVEKTLGMALEDDVISGLGIPKPGNEKNTVPDPNSELAQIRRAIENAGGKLSVHDNQLDITLSSGSSYQIEPIKGFSR